MAIPKVCGIETEYGIMVRGADSNPVTASSLLINAYLAVNYRKVGWDFEDEHPGTRRPRVRGRRSARARHRDQPRQLGADQRCPLLRRPRPSRDQHAGVPHRARGRALRPGRRGDHPREHGGRRRATFPTAPRSCATRTTPTARATATAATRTTCWPGRFRSARIVSQVTPHFVTRQIVIGAGKVGCELPGMSADDVPYQISQRADFFEEEVGLETTLKRPIVNTRDEPHCDASKYRRLHVIVGDANMSEVATLPQGRHHGDRAGDDRRRRARRRLAAGQPGGGHPSGQPRSRRCNARCCCATAGGPRRSKCSGACSSGPASTSARTGSTVVGEAVGPDVLARWEAVLAGLESDRSTRGRRRRLGRQAAADRGIRRAAQPARSPMPG